MALHGKGMLIVYNEVKSPRRARFQRVVQSRAYRRAGEPAGLPPCPPLCRRARLAKVSRDLRMRHGRATWRRRAISHLLANQTPWSQAVMARFTHFRRLTLRVQVDLDARRGRRAHHGALRARSGQARAAARLAARNASHARSRAPGMLGAAAAENDLEVANAPVQPRAWTIPGRDEAEWVVLLEGADPAATGAAARALFKAAALEAVRRPTRRRSSAPTASCSATIGREAREPPA